MNRSAARILGLFLAVISPGIFAADVDFSLHLGDTYTDNVAFSATAPASDHVLGAAAKLAVATQGPRLTGRLVTDLIYLNYLEGSFSDQFLRGFAGDAQWNIVDDNLIWIATENYGPVLEDPLSADRPDNWTYDSYFTTGPDLILGSRTATHMRIGARYGLVDYEAESVPGNHQYSGSLSLVFPSSPRSEKSLNFIGRRVKQDAPDTAPSAFREEDYDTGEAYARVSTRSVRNTLYLDAGASVLRFDGETSTAPLVRLGWERKLSGRFTLNASAGTQYQDTLGRFQRLQNSAGQVGGVGVSNPRNDVVNSPSPLLEKYFDLLLSFDGQRTTLDVRAALNRVDFENSNDPLGKQDYLTATVDIERRITPRWSLATTASYEVRDYEGLDRTDDYLFGYAGSVWRVGPKLDVQLGYYYRERTSDIAAANYTAKSAQLEFVYRFYSQIRDSARVNRWQNVQ